MRHVKQKFNKKAQEQLRLKEVNGHPVHVVEADNPKSLALLQKAYDEVYVPAFPIDEEREDISVWLNNLKGYKPGVQIVIAIAGENLDKPAATLKAISVAYYYADQDAGLLAYNAVSPNAQGQGLGRTMVDARKMALVDFARAKNKPLGAVVIECNDPAKVKPEDDVMDPAVRIRMFEKWGARVVPIDYVQPPLEPGGDKCDTLKLLAYPHPVTGQYPTPAELKAYITGIYKELEANSPMPVEQNPDYIRTVKQLDAMPQGKPFFTPKEAPKAPSPKL